MTGASGMALNHSGGATWYNPAGLGGIGRNRLDLSGSVFVLRLRPMTGALTIQLPSGSYDGGLSSRRILSLPSALVFARGITKKVTMSLGIFVTHLDQYSVTSTLSRDEAEPFTGTMYRYTQRTTVDHFSETYHIGPGIGWQINERFRLGWALFIVYGKTKDTFGFVMDAHTLDPEPTEIRIQAIEDFRLGIWYIGLQATMGLQWELAKGWHLGLLARSPVMAFWQSYEISAVSSALTANQSTGHTGSFLLGEPEDQGAGFEVVYPAQLTLGLAYRHRRFWIGLESDLILPLRNSSAGIDLKLQWNLRAGSRVFFSKKWSAGIGGFTDRTVKNAPRFPTDAIMDYYGVALGLQWRSIYPNVRGSKKEPPLILATSVALRYAFGVGEGSSFHYNILTDDAEFGTVALRHHEVGVFIGSTLLF